MLTMCVLQNIGHLVKLTCLDLTENKLESIPDSIGGLVAVTDLTLSHNFLEALPDSVGTIMLFCYL